MRRSLVPVFLRLLPLFAVALNSDSIE